MSVTFPMAGSRVRTRVLMDPSQICLVEENDYSTNWWASGITKALLAVHYKRTDLAWLCRRSPHTIRDFCHISSAYVQYVYETKALAISQQICVGFLWGKVMCVVSCIFCCFFSALCVSCTHVHVHLTEEARYMAVSAWWGMFVWTAYSIVYK